MAAHKLYCKGECVSGIRDSEHHTFLTWHYAQVKFKLIAVENKDWIMLPSKIINKWWRLLKDDMEVSPPGQWVGFYYDCADNPASFC